MRDRKTIQLKNSTHFKRQLLKWSERFDDIVWFDSNTNKEEYSSYDALLAVDAFSSLKSVFYNAFEKLKSYQSNTNDWIFGYLSYDLKNDIEDLSSQNYDGLGFPELYFFQPKKVFLLKGNTLSIEYLKCVEDEFNDDFNTINKIVLEPKKPHKSVNISLRVHKDEYFNKVNTIKNHILKGDVYEANFCQEFYAENTSIEPIEVYTRLNAISRAPFATFLKMSDKYLLSASPERYIKKVGQKIISQPIKGTAKRSHNSFEDEQLKTNLLRDVKERSENVMIVDLVRNDLSKTALQGTVNVEGLCEISSFKQVHQMISTVVSQVDKSVNPVDIIKATFPMGSMTGAPKISAMKIIEKLEHTKRGLYSGAVGYFKPHGDFDFNVVIRSILYNATKKYISYSVGSAITAKSEAYKEFEECLIKAKAMRQVLEQTN